MSETVMVAHADIGWGHFNRARLIAEALKKDGYEIHFCASEGYCEEAKKYGFESVSEVPAMSWLENAYGVDAIRSFANILFPIGDEKSLIMKFLAKYRALRSVYNVVEPDVAFIDGDMAAMRLMKRRKEDEKKRKVKYVFNTNVIRPAYPHVLKIPAWIPQYICEGYMKGADKITFADLPPEKTISAYNIGNRRKFPNLEFVGPFTDMRRPSGIEDENCILVMSSGTKGNRVRFMRRIQPLMDQFCKESGKTWKMTLGLNISYLDRDDVHEIVGFYDPETLRRNQKKSSVIIHNGSLHTCFEAIANEKMSLVVPTRFQLEQEANARKMNELGLGVELRESELGKLPWEIQMMDERRDEFTRRLEEFREFAEGFDGPGTVVAEIKNLF